MIQSISSKIKIRLFSYNIRCILKVGRCVRSNIFSRLYLDACEMFQSNMLSKNCDIASTATNVLLGLQSLNLPVDDSVNELLNSVSNDEWIFNKVSQYHMLFAYYFSFGNSYPLHSDKIEEALSKAKQAVTSVVSLDSESFKKISIDSKSDQRLLRKRIGVSNKQKIEKEKLEIIKPVKITSTHISMSLTLISTLFFISGFIYTKSFFYWFGINVGDFYSVQDYLSSSIDVISSTALSASLGFVSLVLGLNSALNDELHNGQFAIQESRKDYVLPVILVISCLGLVVSVYTTGRWPSVLMLPAAMSLLIYIYFKIPLWNFIENKITVGTACLVIAFFFMHLGFRVKDNVEKIFFESYKPIYSISLKSEYQEYSKMSYLTSNSNFVFLVDRETKQVVVLPKGSVMSFGINF